MKPSEHRYRDDLSSLTSMRRACSRCAGRPLSQRSMRAPVVEIADIFGQDLLQMVLIENENVIQALGSDGSHPALGYGIGSRRPEWCANLGNTNIAHPTIECGTVTAVAVMNKKIVAACDPKRSIRPFAEPPMRRSDSALRERGQPAGWHDGSRKTRTAV